MEKRKCPGPLVIISDDEEEESDVKNNTITSCRRISSSGKLAHEQGSQDWGAIFVDKKMISSAGQLPETSGSILKTNASKTLQFQQTHMQLWVDKYSPKDLANLAVHSKKVAKIREWLEAQLQDISRTCANSVLLLTGPSGVGKTVTVHILADVLNLQLCEWTAPTPVLWKEHLHQGNSGAPYTSKLQEFEAFLERAKKYPLLPVSSLLLKERDGSISYGTIGLRKSKMLLLDDLPTVYSRESLLHLCHCLHSFTLSVQFPTIIIMTDYVGIGEISQEVSRSVVELQQAVESAGATKITLNRVTANVIGKFLTKISAAENHPIPAESISLIAESCGGDIRHAICSMQFFCLGQHLAQSPWDPGGARVVKKKLKRRKMSEIGGSKASPSSLCFPQTPGYQNEFKTLDAFRDVRLSFFHALGKLLHNKRHTDVAMDSGSAISLIVKEGLRRHPLNMEEPEIILSQAHTEVGVIAAFLHENCTGCKRSSAAACIALLNDCETDPRYVAEVAAGSVAARGVLFANTHPAPRRWQSLRAPALQQVQWQLSKKMAEMRAKQWTSGLWNLCSVSKIVQSIEYQPYLKHMMSNITRDVKPFICERQCQSDFDIMEICEAESDAILPLSQEQQLLTGFHKFMELDQMVDSVGEYDVEDEIEEW
eukprot:c26388_g1_i3 orf=233-2194(-)